MTIVPGMWFKLIHGNHANLNERYCVDSIFFNLGWNKRWYPTFNKYVRYRSYFYKSSINTWVNNDSFTFLLEDFEKAFEPDTL